MSVNSSMDHRARVRRESVRLRACVAPAGVFSQSMSLPAAGAIDLTDNPPESTAVVAGDAHQEPAPDNPPESTAVVPAQANENPYALLSRGD